MPVLYPAECRNIFLTSITSWYRETTTTIRRKLCVLNYENKFQHQWIECKFFVFFFLFFSNGKLIRQEETVEQEEKQEYWHETNDNE